MIFTCDLLQWENPEENIGIQLCVNSNNFVLYENSARLVTSFACLVALKRAVYNVENVC